MGAISLELKNGHMELLMVGGPEPEWVCVPGPGKMMGTSQAFECHCNIVRVYWLHDLSAATRRPDTTLLTTTAARVDGRTLTLSLSRESKTLSSKLKQRETVSLDRPAANALGYESVTILPGQYEIKGSTLTLNVGLGKPVRKTPT